MPIHMASPLRPIWSYDSTPPSRPFERVSVDLIKLPKTKNGNSYIIAFIDEFTRWPEAMAISDKNAETVLNAMKELILTRHGVPAILLSDEGPEFFNKLVFVTCKQYGVTKVFSAAYRSRGHGMIERLNRTIEDRLKHTANRRCDDWDVWLPDALFAIRSTPSRGTRLSPFLLLYGHEPTMPIDTALLLPIHRQHSHQT
jgi:transposase InsO family protein